MSTAKEKKIDSIFLGILSALLLIGVVVFVSASLGVLAKNETKFYGILVNQILFGLGGGLVAMVLVSKIPYKFWRKYALYFFIGSLLLMPLVFIPGLGFEHGGAKRWINLGFITFQPAELLKLGCIIYFAAWLSWAKHKINDFRFGLLPLLVMLAISAGVLLIQPDTKSFLLIIVSMGTMFFISGVSWKYFFGVTLVGIIVATILVLTTPYIQARIQTFINPNSDQQGSSYQLKQSLIAIGSGGVFGRGLGQSVQKFSYLPEPQGDSIFSVIGEEFGFVGSVFVLILYVAFAFRGLRIGYRAPDQFSRLLVSGIVILITAQSFLNIASIVGIFPLTGVPLVFMSQGGTSLLLSLASVGIILQVSKYQREPNSEKNV